MPITFEGEPKSTQRIYRASCIGGHPTTYMTRDGKALKERYQWEAKSQWRQPPIEGDVELAITFYFATKRRRDIDNQNKLIFDALSGIVYADDSQVSDLHLHRHYDREHPRIEIMARPAPNL